MEGWLNARYSKPVEESATPENNISDGQREYIKQRFKEILSSKLA